jgi:prevent-host-death family protein
MPKAVSIEEIEREAGAIIDRVADRGDEIIVEAKGAPRAAIISYDEYRRVRTLREREARREASDTLARLRDKVSAANPDLTDDERLDLADRAVRDAVVGLEAKGELPGDG